MDRGERGVHWGRRAHGASAVRQRPHRRAMEGHDAVFVLLALGYGRRALTKDAPWRRRRLALDGRARRGGKPLRAVLRPGRGAGLVFRQREHGRGANQAVAVGLRSDGLVIDAHGAFGAVRARTAARAAGLRTHADRRAIHERDLLWLLAQRLDRRVRLRAVSAVARVRPRTLARHAALERDQRVGALERVGADRVFGARTGSDIHAEVGR